jgi:hypothetical protein
MAPRVFTNLQKKLKNQYASEVQQPYQEYLTAGKAALPSLYAPAYQSILDQFRPQSAGVDRYLASTPYAARSGVATRLRSNALSNAAGALGTSYGQASAGVAQGGLSLLDQLIQRRVQQRYEERNAKAQKIGVGSVLGSVVGAGLGAVGGPVASAVGQKIGSKINPGAVF